MLTDIFFSLNFWLIAGVVLCLLELFTGAFIALASGISCLIMAIWLYTSNSLPIQWQSTLVIFAVIDLIICVILIKLFKKTNSTPDVND